MDSHGGCSPDHLNHYSFLHEPSTVDFNSIQGWSQGGMRRLRSEADMEEDQFSAGDDDEEAGNLSRPPGKKRRLSPEQVRLLEKSFEVENKLEPERKIQIAKELGLQPRQVAIWFQNRRARFKTKQLERDYDVLKSDFDSLKTDYDSLLLEKDRMQNEVSVLKARLNLRESSNSNSPNHRPAPEKSAAAAAEVLPACKQEEASSAKSDVFDSESPHCTEGNYSSEEVEDPAGNFLPVAEVAVFDGNARGGAGLPGLEGQPSYWPWFY